LYPSLFLTQLCFSNLGERHDTVDNRTNLTAFDEVAQNLFDPYVTTKTSGSGLGLAIVQKIVDEHGGSVRVGRADQGGAKFIVLLPISDAANDALGNPGAEPLKSRVMR